MSIDLVSLVRIVPAIVAIIAAVGLVVGIASGLIPVLLRLGRGLNARKVAIFATGPNLAALENVLTDSRLFKAKNIVVVNSRSELGRAETASVFVVYWAAWKDHIDDIIRLKKDSTALLIYAPQVDGYIPKEAIEKLELERNVVISNFRGRMLNDLIVAMMATAYEKK
ncbi:hypothetical protein HPO_09505 [Hyphomonas polymorpha PS728]|uniref:Uncharacterized protein n=1 Tax=Hyphomonas polymorpha PS728 TaxID=1280954 RepID=A0A062VG53_9PROT|nr:hypothetical protein [Hyphomonas polymorpha]KCZ98438.1 hypothetical protein HPO_09505 [Hyphomonas polymorpha PS728]